jgi:4,5-DOPA dioxygenase extradiol
MADKKTEVKSQKPEFLNDMYNVVFEETAQMPLLFIGHGSPMNAIEENQFVKGWRDAAHAIPTPKAILCISAHWETEGTLVTAMKNPRTIHDFGGFPRKLYEVQYPAPGSPELADITRKLVKTVDVYPDENWGLDHGCWSVVRQMYPGADIPVVQLSLDLTRPGKYHFELAKELKSLRKMGILIMGSGNIVHNLRKIDWDNPSGGFDWAEEANAGIKKMILSGEYDKLTDIAEMSSVYKMAVPTPEHYNPLLYVLGLKEENEEIEFFNDEIAMGSISMTSIFIFGYPFNPQTP